MGAGHPSIPSLIPLHQDFYLTFASSGPRSGMTQGLFLFSDSAPFIVPENSPRHCLAFPEIPQEAASWSSLPSLSTPQQSVVTTLPDLIDYYFLVILMTSLPTDVVPEPTQR